MSIYASNVADRVRLLVGDKKYTRWLKADMTLWTNDAVTIIRSARSDSQLDSSSGDYLTLTPVPDMGSTRLLSVGDKYLPAIAQYVASLCFQQEGGNKADRERSKMHMDNFTALLAVL